VHRVRAPPSGDPGSKSRVSAPFLIRGLYTAKFTPRCHDYFHEGGEDALGALADLDGVSMKEIHKILDFKRLKCVKENQDSGKDWVLSAYSATIT
jgi:hypothetical protein